MTVPTEVHFRDTATMIANGNIVSGVIADSGPLDNGWREVSIHMLWEAGVPATDIPNKGPVINKKAPADQVPYVKIITPKGQ